MKKRNVGIAAGLIITAATAFNGVFVYAEELTAQVESVESEELETESIQVLEPTLESVDIAEPEMESMDISESETGVNLTGIQTDVAEPETAVFTTRAVVEKSGFVTDESGSVYYYDPSTKEMVKGEKYIKGHWYYFDESTGIMAVGWTEHHGNRYYYNKDGWMQYGSQTIDGKKYNFDPVTGVLITNVERVEGGHWVYYGADGAKATGWTKHHGNTYYYNEKGWMLYGSQTIDGKQYNFDNVTGVLITNVEKVEGGHWVYYGSDGAKATGWTKHHGNTYYYNEKGWMLYGSQTIDGNKYYFDPVTGVMYKGEKVVSGHWVYFSEEDGAMATGWTEHHGNRYYYNNKGWMLYGSQMIDGKVYTFDKITGVLQYGFYEADGKVYYRNKEGEQLFGEQIIEGKKILFDETTGALLTGLRVIDDETYYYVNKAPYVYTGEIYLKGHWRYFDEKTGVMATGWTEHHGHRYYYNENGEMLYGAQTIDGKTYYFDTVTGIEKDTLGWVQEGSSWVYYEGDYRKYDISDLRTAFNWSSSSVAYQSLSGAPSGTSHVAWYGEYGVKNQRGNCYVMAATFCHMARLMGYEAYLVEGSVPLAAGGMGPHGWCEIVVNGTTYVCDPDFTYETGRNGYFITYGTSGTWRYSNYRRVD